MDAVHPITRSTNRHASTPRSANLVREVLWSTPPRPARVHDLVRVSSPCPVFAALGESDTPAQREPFPLGVGWALVAVKYLSAGSGSIRPGVLESRTLQYPRVCLIRSCASSCVSSPTVKYASCSRAHRSQNGTPQIRTAAGLGQGRAVSFPLTPYESLHRSSPYDRGTTLTYGWYRVWGVLWDVLGLPAPFLGAALQSLQPHLQVL